ncbi:rhomboid-like protein 11, chloroplastic [Beta vulgaris subsp. vulgaris]|uniref:rhomboid-like protein 11, chloroplastic n=1 Tax=Beta vulgaris subsp. vulgaris TaxID=3555 RepID=UPI002036B961|nr:rhomboid-like protein 11, chloroplastic [Beta vulgaris subsp. vulgaris]
MAQVQQLLTLRSHSSTNGIFIPINRPQFNSKLHVFGAIYRPSNVHKLTLPTFTHLSTSRPSPFSYPHQPTSGFRQFCKFNDLDSISQLELGKQARERRPEKRVNAVFWIILLNLAIYAADHLFLVRDIKSLYLFHNQPAWYQFVTAAFCHANWNHLSSNLFFLYIFGKLVEEEEGSFALWFSYILTGAGANLVSWLVLPRNAVSVGASGAVFGLFAISVLVKMSMDWRKILEVLILGQFVIEKVMEAAQASTGLSNGFIGTNSLQSVNHIAHLSGALVGVLLVWLLSKVPSDASDKEGLAEKPDRNR